MFSGLTGRRVLEDFAWSEQAFPMLETLNGSMPRRANARRPCSRENGAMALRPGATRTRCEVLETPGPTCLRRRTRRSSWKVFAQGVDKPAERGAAKES